MTSTEHGPVHDGSNRDPIAIVGIGCRFPGGVDTPRAFWDLLCNGVDAIGPMPADRFDVDAYYHPTPATPGKIVTRDGGWLGGIDEFDAEFFGISAREAIWLDPQQRLLLEVAWEALEDAGLPRQRVAGSRTGVFIGMWTNDYVERAFAASDDVDLYVTTGGGRYSAAGRLSFAFDLRGPSLTVDTACSSSLVAVHLACQSLRRGESELALAGGANLILQPQISIGYSRSGMLSPDARCKFGDADANGYVRSEGIGVVVLKPLAAALAAGDPIYALIRGTAVNSDGRSNGLLVAPSKPGQEAMLREAYRDAELDPALVGYVEAHGTGTRAGDPVEVEALGSVLGTGRPADRPCLIGSVKTNIGHTEAASGVAGLIKAALCLQHRHVPANLHLRKPNPSIAWQDLGFIMPRTLTHWPAGGAPGFAGVNSFGVTGTNAHVVLQEAPRGREPERATPPGKPRAELLVLSAHTPTALVDLAERYRAVIEEDPPSASFGPHDLCFTAAVRRSHHEHRLAVVGRTRGELAAHLGAFARGENSPSVVSGRVDAVAEPRVVFVFPGQGSQWPGMARQLLAHEPAFRAGLERCEQAMRPFVNWSLLERVNADPAETSIHEIDVVQPVLFAIQVALVALWRSWGVEPDAVIGHSMGEVAAAHVAGALSLEDAAQIICCRSRLLRRTSGRGAMAMVELSLDEARAALAGYEERLAVAVSNGPRSTVLSGDPVVLDEVLQRLERSEVFCRRVKVDVASHSPQMDPLRADLHRLLAGLHPTAAAVPIYSTVRGDMTDGATLDAEYWVRNLREPVLFWPALQRLLADEYTVFVELSPHPVLLPAIQQGLQHEGSAGLALPSMRRGEDERAVMLGTLGALYAAGYPVDWNALYPAGGQVVRVPTYPWQRERYWMDTPTVRPSSPRTAAPPEATAVEHPLLGRRLQLADRPGDAVWEGKLYRDTHPNLYEHRVGGATVLPASAYIEMALAAATEAYGPGPYGLSNVALRQALFLREDGSGTTIQVVLLPMSGDLNSFRVFSRTGDIWTLHASGLIHPVDQGMSPLGRPDYPALGEWRRSAQLVSGDEFYRHLETKGICFGQTLQRVTALWRDSSQVVARLDSAGAERPGALGLDACFQLSAAIPTAYGATDDIYMPTAIEEVCIYGSSETGVWGCACQRPGTVEDTTDSLVYDVAYCDDNGQALSEIRGLRLQRLGRATVGSATDHVYALGWQPVARAATAPAVAASAEGTWLILADRAGVGFALARRLRGRGARAVLAFQSDTSCPEDGDCCEIRPGSPEDMQALVAHLVGPEQPTLRGIVQLWSLDVPWPTETTVASLDRALTFACMSTVHAVQAVDRLGGMGEPSFWLVTRGAQAPIGGGAPGLAQAPLWGLGRVLGEEHPGLWGGLIDLDAAIAADEAADLLSVELLTPSEEREIALSGGQRYVPRLLRPCGELPARHPYRWRADGTYLITGGLGDIGLRVAHWMVEQGARRLVLMGRTPLPPRVKWNDVAPASVAGRRIAAVGELEALGASVHLATIDVADEIQLTDWLNAFQREAWPPICGVIHAAGMVDDRLLCDLDLDAIQAVLRPKAIGGWLLDRLFPELDFFVLFSSVGSLIGLPGQTSYAAANAFLDGLAHYRRARGQVALSINWGPWRDLGFAATSGGQQAIRRLEQQGFGSITPEQGLAALGRLLASASDPESGAQAVVLPAEWHRVGRTRLAPGRSTPLSVLATRIVEQPGAAGMEAAPAPADNLVSGLREELLALAPQHRRARLEAHLSEQLGNVVRIAPSRIDPTKPLGSMGVDSLMSQELRNRLEATTGVALSATIVWNYPTVAQMAGHLAAKMGVPLVEDPQKDLDAPSREWDQRYSSAMREEMGDSLAAVEALSEAEALARLVKPR